MSFKCLQSVKLVHFDKRLLGTILPPSGTSRSLHVQLFKKINKGKCVFIVTQTLMTISKSVLSLQEAQNIKHTQLCMGEPPVSAHPDVFPSLRFNWIRLVLLLINSQSQCEG